MFPAEIFMYYNPNFGFSKIPGLVDIQQNSMMLVYGHIKNYPKPEPNLAYTMSTLRTYNRKHENNDVTLSVLILKPGGLSIRTTPTLIQTAVGSCLAITMFAPRQKIGAISHPMLPFPPEHERQTCFVRDLRKYVSFVVSEMLRKMKHHDVQTHDIEVKIFGGGELFGQYGEQQENRTVGRLNVQTVMQLIESERLFLKTFDVGGNRGRKILFYTHSGEVLVKRLNNRIVTSPVMDG